MHWGFSTNDELKDFLNSMEKAHPGALWERGGGKTPDWMDSLNKLYRRHKNAPAEYRDKLLDTDTDLDNYDPYLEYEIANNPVEYYLDNHFAKYKGDYYERLSKAFVEGMAARKKEEALQKEKEESMLKDIGINTPGDIANYIRQNLDVSPYATDEQLLNSETFLIARKMLLDEAYDKAASSRGIMHPILKFGVNDYLEDYFYDDYGNKIDPEDAYTNNFAWFKNKFDIKDGSDLEYNLKEVLKKHRQDGSDYLNKNILKALAPDDEGGIY